MAFHNTLDTSQSLVHSVSTTFKTQRNSKLRPASHRELGSDRQNETTFISFERERERARAHTHTLSAHHPPNKPGNGVARGGSLRVRRAGDCECERTARDARRRAACGCGATQDTGPLCPPKTCTQVQSEQRQTAIVPSSLAESACPEAASANHDKSRFLLFSYLATRLARSRRRRRPP